MRDAACQAWVELAREKKIVFLTGDLGFRALEPLREALGDRFVNAGVAEQNMIGMAAGMAHEGEEVWVYSIGPFCYARPFEQIRNDVCLHRLPVKLVGNGGGYGYGSMGASHHSLEDYGALLTLPGMRVFAPAFREDVAPAVRRLSELDTPGYLRLGRCELPAGQGAPTYRPWRRLQGGQGPVAAVVGPLAGVLIAASQGLDPEHRPTLWIVAELPVEPDGLPTELLADLEGNPRLLVVEEHVAQGGFGAAMAYALARRGVTLDRFEHRCAIGYPSGRYGSQAFHRQECGLDGGSLSEVISEMGASA